jgi:signal transduction histidine kinase
VTSIARLSSRHLRGLLATAIVLSAAALVLVGYRAVAEWQNAASLVAARRAEAAADLLVSALSHDMRGAHLSALASAERDAQSGDATIDLLHTVAGAFARYPYVEAFFAWQAAPAASVIFFSRAERQPDWLHAVRHDAPFPVGTGTDPALGQALLARIGKDTEQGRRFSAFSTRLDGGDYQVVASIAYRDPKRERAATIVGFLVNLQWAREHYFADLVSQVGDIEGSDRGVHFAILDDRGSPIVGARPAAHGGVPAATRTFPAAFFDPTAVAIDPPADLGLVSWTAVATARDDPTLAAAERGARRTLGIAAVMTLTLAVGLIASLQAARVSANLAVMRADFVSAVTHELKTPIANMRAISETLAAGRTTPDMIREYAQMGVSEANRLTRLVDNLLAYSRVTDIADVYSFEPLALGAAVQRSLQEFAGTLTRDGFDVQVDVPDDLPLVQADPNALGLMLNNVIDNAIRYSSERRSLTIIARAAELPPGHALRHHEAVRLDIADRGVGIPDDELRRVTRKFMRGRGSVSGGSGLGLAIVDRIVTDHHGTLSIASVAGQGTTVSVTIPTAQS